MSEAQRRPALIYFIAGLAAFAAVAYELLLASYATFLMGASVFQYALVLSLMMASMGTGALLTKKRNAVTNLLLIESLLALLSLVALPSLYTLYALGTGARSLLLLFVFLIGTAIGMEIPLLNAALPTSEKLPFLLFCDYLGGFLGGILFPLLLMPHLGFFKISAILALLNTFAAVALLFALPRKNRVGFRKWFALLLLLGFLSMAYFHYSDTMRHYLEARYFQIK